MDEARPSIRELTESVGRLQRRVETLEAENARLRGQLEQANRRSKRQAAPFRKGPPKPDPKKPGRKSGPDHGTHGHRPSPPPEAVDEVLDAPLPDCCPHCDGSLTETGLDRQFQTDIPRRPTVRRFDVHVGRCRRCRRRVRGRHPLQTSDAVGAAASQVGPDAQAAVVTLNKQAGLSHAKISACFDDLFGIDLSRGASAQIVLRAAGRLEPAYREIRESIAESERLAVDETGWRVGGRPAWLHVWVGDRATCYAVDRHRHAGALQEVIGLDYDGVLVHDGWASYDRFEDAIHQRCVAHVLRRAREMLEGAAGGAVRFPRQVIDIFTSAIHLRNEYLAGRVPEPEWESARDRFEDRLLPLLLRPRASPESRRLAEHLRNHFASWFSFLTDETLEAANWRAEQAIRPAVVNRKVYGGNRTWAGARAQGVLCSVLRSCRQQRKAGLDFISETLRAFRSPTLPRPVLLATR